MHTEFIRFAKLQILPRGGLMPDEKFVENNMHTKFTRFTKQQTLLLSGSMPDEKFVEETCIQNLSVFQNNRFYPVVGQCPAKNVEKT